MLFCDRVKIFTDGGLGASTAALLEPYTDDPEGNNREILTDTKHSFLVFSIKNNVFSSHL